MNKNFAIFGLVLLLLVGGSLIYVMGRTVPISDNELPAPSDTSNNTNNTNTTTKQEAGSPNVITNSSVSPSDTTAIVNGTVNPKGAFTSYWYEYGNTSNLGSKTGNQTIGSGFVAIQAPGYITELVKNTTYYFRLVAENQYGRVTGSQFTFKTTEGNPPPVGNAPTTKTLAANGVSRTTANLRGEVTPNKAETQYWFEYGKTTQLGNTSAFSGAGSGNAKVPVSISLSDLEPLTTYYFRLNAQNQFGTINGSILNFKTLGPSASRAPSVTTGSATPIGKTDAVLHGTVTPNFSETKYWFEYSVDSIIGSILVQTTDPVSVGAGGNVVPVDKSISDLQPNTTYYFRIIGQNNLGTARGEEHTFKTKPN